MINLGLQPGDLVYVHTSLKSIGPINGGANTLIEAFLSVLGPNGTIAVPTHTLSYEHSGYDSPYNKTATSCLPAVGTFPDIFWRYPGAKRSGHGSHSSAAIGALCDYLTDNHDPRNALGYNSPLRRVYEKNGKILLLGVGQNRNTTVHLAESMARMPYVKLPYALEWGNCVIVEDGGNIDRFEQIEYPGCSSEFNIVNDLMGDHIKSGRIGSADSALMDAKKLVDTVIAALDANHGLLLCHDTHCCCCPRKWDLLRSQGTSS